MVKVGTPRNPLSLVPKSKEGCTSKSVEAKSADSDTLITLNVVPSTTFSIDVPNDFNLGQFHRGEVHVDLKDNDMYKTSCVMCASEIAKVLEEKFKDKIFSCMNTDRGGDKNPKFELVQACM